MTSQGQISIPADVRRKLGLRAGSVIGWHQVGEEIVVRREGRFTSHEIHKVLFPEGPPERKSLDELREGIARHIREKHGRR